MGCEELQLLLGYEAKCSYLSPIANCVSDGYINYLYLFYCFFEDFPALGYILLALWILVLFYVLGDTASNYFCSCLENLSRLLKLSPTIAGVTLLSLGNGAPDVFSSLVSFTGGGAFDVGFNTVLGGASMVTCVVGGVVSILVRERRIQVHRAAFARTIGFYLFVIIMLLLIFVFGKINLWGAILFWSTYVIYVMIVYFWNSEDDEIDDQFVGVDEEAMAPFLHVMENGREGVGSEKMWRVSRLWEVVLLCVGMVFSLPRRLTIPIICEARWSKFYFVTSICLSPTLLTTLWYLQEIHSKLSTVMVVYGIGVVVGGGLGVLGYYTCECSTPPNKLILLWLVLGFVMSMIWSYIVAEELLGLLLSIGYIVGISPSILGFTVLAWGNSIGDLITDSTMAAKGGSRGARVAISGCYAGPMFNIVFGLGVSMICASWDTYPSSIAITWDPHLVETLGILSCCLLWTALNLWRREGKLDAPFGAGCIAIYIFLFIRRLFSRGDTTSN